ncbi:MAG TPA: DUF5666 domain-containing protein [Thermoanaerobaculia bacterium]|nr:DUF5666 domain-containing protein [Thermoanaerobaculia bacterium]
MNTHRSLKLIALTSILTLPLGTVACSNGSSPTEPAFSDDQVVAASTSGLSSVTAESKGSDDQGADDRGGNGNDDKNGDNRGGKSGKGGKKGGKNGGRDDNQKAGKEFEGAVASVGQSSLTLANGTRIVVNGQTQWIARGDLHSLTEIADSLASGDPTRVEGRGARQADGSILARTLKAEVDN